VLHHVIDDLLGIRDEHSLRQRLRLREQGPWPERQREARVPAAEHLARRNDVENGEARDALRVIGENRAKPSCSIMRTMSRAIALFAYGA